MKGSSKLLLVLFSNGAEELVVEFSSNDCSDLRHLLRLSGSVKAGEERAIQSGKW